MYLILYAYLQIMNIIEGSPVRIYHTGCHGREERLIDCESEKHNTLYSIC